MPLTAIAERTLAPEQLGRVRAAVEALLPIGCRLAFMHAPFALEQVVAAGTEFGSNVMILDYIQRFTVGDGSKDKREQLETAATVLRRFCDAGAAVLVASAVSRQKGATGSNYSGLNLASFRGSSELEYGTDSAFLFVPDESGGITLQCGKNRYGAVGDIVTRFDPTIQTFSSTTNGICGFDDATPAANKGRRAKVS